MFSWVGGLKSGTGPGTGPGTGTTGTGDAQHDSTFVDAPDTPAPVFALRAFKHAIYGTPQQQQQQQQNSSSVSLRKKSSDSILRPSQEQPRWLPSTSDQRPVSPSKPNGILMTPGTVNNRRKQVTFGSQVKDEQDDLPIAGPSRSALPNSTTARVPLLPTAKSKEDEKLEKLRKRTKSARSERKSDRSDKTTFEVPVQALELLGAVSYHQMHSRKHSNTSHDDDAHATDIDDPQSESGRYWKEAFESYSDRSEAETKVLIAKARLAKDFARKKDEEVMELTTALEIERRRNGGDKQTKNRREELLEAQVMELREKLRLQAAENSRISAELAALRRQSTGNLALSVPQVISHKHQASRTDSVQSDAFNDPIIPEEPIPEDDIYSSNNISIWAAAGATSDSRRSVETIKSSTSNHIIAQMSGALGATRAKTRTDKLRRTTSNRQGGDDWARSTTSTASTSSSSNPRSEASVRLQVPEMPAYSAFATTPLSPIDDTLEDGGPTDSRDGRPHTADTERPSSRSTPNRSSPTLPLKLVSQESASAGLSNESDVQRVDFKRRSSPPHMGETGGTDSEGSEDNSLPPSPPPKNTSQPLVSFTDLGSRRQSILRQFVKPSEVTAASNSPRSGSPVPSLTKSRHAPSSSSSGVLPQYEKENIIKAQAGSRKKTSGAIIDADRLAAARARIAARKANGPKT